VDGAGVRGHGQGDLLLREHPQSPLEPADRVAGSGPRYFDYDPRYRLAATLVPPESGAELQIDTGGSDGVVRCLRVGRLVTGLGELTLFRIGGYGGGLFLPLRDATSGRETYGGGRYLVDTVKGTFGRALTWSGHAATGRAAAGRDAAGRDAVGRDAVGRDAVGHGAVGRRVAGHGAVGHGESAPGWGWALTVDFNYAYNPSCAYSPRYACPLAPRENWLAAPVPAGELTYQPTG
jgi:uncharacterized protein (DUF1684 family)